MNSKKSKLLPKGVILVLGGTGKTGRRVASSLKEKGYEYKIGSRSAHPSFDWNQPDGWDACLEGVDAVYINYAPDLAVPGAKESITDFVKMAHKKNVKKLVLLSGRGEEEAQDCERVVQECGIPSTIVRAGWFNQNFSEGAFVSMVNEKQITLPGGKQLEPWVDVDDIADVIVASLIESGHEGQLYEVTGPRLMSFSDLASDLSSATGESIQYIEIPHEAFIEELKKKNTPKDVIWLIDYLFSTVLDGRNAHICDGIERALGRPPKDFRDYAKNAYQDGAWSL